MALIPDQRIQVDFPEDSRLVAQLRTGDREAFRQVYERYKGDVLALVTTMLGRPQEALDLLHDVFVSLARNASSLWPDTNLKAFLMTAAANKARDHLRRFAPATMDGEADDPPSPQAADPLRVISAEEEAQRLSRALASLPEEQRIVVALHIHGALTFKEIAAREGESENTIQSRYRYALEKLRRSCSGEKP